MGGGRARRRRALRGVGAQRGRRGLKLINEGGVRVGWLWVSATAKS